jgi:intraflagellar transport protein 80
MLRSVLAQAGWLSFYYGPFVSAHPPPCSASPVYAAAWNGSGSAVVYAAARVLVIKPMQPTSKTEQWKAHDGVVLAVAWGSVTNTIISSGEDCRYRVWDAMGRPLYSSSVHEHPISSIAWSPRGDVFAVGGYNMLRLCDAAGWSHSLDNTTTGSIYNLAWTSNGTAVAGACADGQVLTATLLGRQVG